MVEAFVALARGTWEDTRGQIVPRKAGTSEKFIPFSQRGTEQNRADTRFRRGAIEFALKLPTDELHRVDPKGRTQPLTEQTGRWASYNGGRRFVLQNQEDVLFLKNLILTCVTKMPGASSARGTAGPVQPPERELDFGFVRSTDLREVLRGYWAEARATVENGCWTRSLSE
jgi:hypothetical protein